MFAVTLTLFDHHAFTGSDQPLGVFETRRDAKDYAIGFVREAFPDIDNACDLTISIDYDAVCVHRLVEASVAEDDLWEPILKISIEEVKQ